MMSKIEIILAKTQEERASVYDFFRKNIFEAYGNYPSPLEEDMEIIYSKKDNVIVGSIGVYFGDVNTKLPFQKIFYFDKNNLPIETENNKIAFISRWTSIENNIGMLMSYHAGRYILNSGYKIGSCILKPNVAKYLNILSDESWFLISEASLIKDAVLEEDLNYFLNDPKPLPYLGLVEKYVENLSKNKVISKFETEVKINFL